MVSWLQHAAGCATEPRKRPALHASLPELTAPPMPEAVALVMWNMKEDILS